MMPTSAGYTDVTPSSVLAEDTALTADEVLLAVLSTSKRKDIVFMLRSEGRLFAGAKICGAGACACLNTTPLTHVRRRLLRT